MAKLFLKLIFAGRKTFEEVPEIYQAEVKNLILKKFLNRRCLFWNL